MSLIGQIGDLGVSGAYCTAHHSYGCMCLYSNALNQQSVNAHQLGLGAMLVTSGSNSLGHIVADKSLFNSLNVQQNNLLLLLE